MINVSIRQVCLFLSRLTGHQNPVINELSFWAQYPLQNETDLQKNVTKKCKPRDKQELEEADKQEPEEADKQAEKMKEKRLTFRTRRKKKGDGEAVKHEAEKQKGRMSAAFTWAWIGVGWVYSDLRTAPRSFSSKPK